MPGRKRTGMFCAGGLTPVLGDLTMQIREPAAHAAGYDLTAVTGLIDVRPVPRLRSSRAALPPYPTGRFSIASWGRPSRSAFPPPEHKSSARTLLTAAGPDIISP